MKIALVTLDYPPERGGVARYLGNLVEASRGSIEVFVPEYHIPSGPGKVQNVPFFASGPVPWRPLIWHLYQLKKRGYDLVLVSHALPVGTAAWLARLMGGLPYVVLLHGLDVRLAMRSWHKTWILRRLLRVARLTLTNSRFVADEIKLLVPNLAPQVLTPAVESLAFPDRTEARHDLHISDEACIVLSVTRLVPRKGIDLLLQAMPHLPSRLRLVVIGDGEDAGRLGQISEERGLSDRVTFLSRITDEERNRWYAAADLFAMPTRDEGTDVEGFGIVYLEAALAGLPIVAGRSGGAPEAIEEGVTGRLVDTDRVEHLVAVIQDLYDHPVERERLGRAGRARALRDFRWGDRWQTLQSWLT